MSEWARTGTNARNGTTRHRKAYLAMNTSTLNERSQNMAQLTGRRLLPLLPPPITLRPDEGLDRSEMPSHAMARPMYVRLYASVVVGRVMYEKMSNSTSGIAAVLRRRYARWRKNSETLVMTRSKHTYEALLILYLFMISMALVVG